MSCACTAASKPAKPVSCKPFSLHAQRDGSGHSSPNLRALTRSFASHLYTLSLMAGHSSAAEQTSKHKWQCWGAEAQARPAGDTSSTSACPQICSKVLPPLLYHLWWPHPSCARKRCAPLPRDVQVHHLALIVDHFGWQGGCSGLSTEVREYGNSCRRPLLAAEAGLDTL